MEEKTLVKNMEIIPLYAWHESNNAKKRAKLFGYPNERGECAGDGIGEYMAVDKSRLYPKVTTEGNETVCTGSLSNN